MGEFFEAKEFGREKSAKGTRHLFDPRVNIWKALGSRVGAQTSTFSRRSYFAFALSFA
jgi:hypothetical protein